MRLQIPNSKFQIPNEGFALVTVLIIMAILLLLGTGILVTTIFDLKISKSQKIATQTYYLAEAGINEAIWKLNNDDTIKNNFLNGTFSDDEIVNRDDNVFGDNKASYSVTAISTAPAEASLTATSTYQIGDRKAKRVIKTEVFRAIGSPTDGIVILPGGKGHHDELKIKNARLNVYNGDLFSNHDVFIDKGSEVRVENGKILAVKKLKIEDGSTVNVSNGNLFCNHDMEIKGGSEVEVTNGKILTVNKFKPSGGSSPTAPAICAENICDTTSTCECEDNPEFQECKDPTEAPLEGKCRPQPIDSILMPGINFDSLKSQAKSAGTFYTKKVFEEKLWDDLEKGTTTTLDGITYVEGKKDCIQLRGGVKVVVNGLLVAEGNIKIGKDQKWGKHHEGEYEGDSQLTINEMAEKASGLLSGEGKIEFGEYAASSTIQGLLYATKEIKFRHVSKTLRVEGGIIAKKIRFENFKDGGELNVYLDDTINSKVLGDQQYSPVIDIEHWEETY